MENTVSINVTQKDFLGFENSRNKRHADTYTRLLKRALSGRGEVAVLIGHHLTFEINGDLETENEVPSADCLMFDHDLMHAVFGERAIPIMQRLASVPCNERDDLLKWNLDAVEAAEKNRERMVSKGFGPYA